MMKSTRDTLAVFVAMGCFVAAGAGAAEKPAVDEKTVRLQVWLDHENFGPGKIDGKGGEFTSKALALYHEAHPDAKVNKTAPETFQEPTFADYELREQDWSHVGELPKTREEQSQLKVMPYARIEEFVAERFHADVSLILALNPAMKTAVKTGDVLKVPNVPPFEIEKLPKGGSPQVSAGSDQRSVEIQCESRMLRVLENGRMIAAFPITCGSERLPAPVGFWKVESTTWLPPFRWDREMLEEGKRGKDALNLPPGPRNPVGILWMGLNKTGIGIHGTDNPESIGRSESHGCIRLANWDAVKVATMVAKGAVVEIK